MLFLFAPDLANYLKDHHQSWTVYLASGEMVRAGLCLLLAGLVPAFRYQSLLAAVWFTTQTADELMNGNLFTDQRWEYLLLAGICLVIVILNRR